MRHFELWWSCGFLGDLRILPANVSFLNLYFKEEEVGATASGWLEFLTNEGHHPGGSAVIGFGSISTGARVVADDEIFSGKYNTSGGHGAYNTGQVNWAIPWKYSVDNTTWHSIGTGTFSQTASSTSTGKCTISKVGSGSHSKELTEFDSEW